MTYTIKFVNFTLGAPFQKIQAANWGCVLSPSSMVATPMVTVRQDNSPVA